MAAFIGYGRKYIYLLPGILFSLLFILRSGFADQDSFFPTLFDDAMISMSYAKTLAESGEFVWFDGAPRLQGFSNLGWTLFLYLLHLASLGPSWTILIVQIIGVLVLIKIATTALSLIQVSSINLPCWKSKLSAGAIMLLYPIVFWTLRGMEVGIISLALLLVLKTIWELDANEQSMRLRAKLFSFSILGIFIRFDFGIFLTFLILARIRKGLFQLFQVQV